MPPIPIYRNLMGIWLEVGRRCASWAAWSAIRNQAGGLAQNRRSIFLKRPLRSASAAGATCRSSVEWRPISCAIPLRSSRRDNTVRRSYDSALSMAGDIPHSPDARISRTTAVCSPSPFLFAISVARKAQACALDRVILLRSDWVVPLL